MFRFFLNIIYSYFLNKSYRISSSIYQKQNKQNLSWRKYYFYTKKKKINHKWLKSFFYFKIQIFHLDFLFLYIYNKSFFLSSLLAEYFSWAILPKLWLKIRQILRAYKTVFKESFLYLRTLSVIFLIDATFTDDEPLWEPIEWSLVMTWIFFIFLFAWIAENLITSRYGSYTGRDKRVWLGWFKTFWLLDAWFAISYGIASMFVILPFYSELVYPISFSFSWWHWYTRIFFYKFISLFSIMLLLSIYVQFNLRWLNWKKLMNFCILINCILVYLLYTQLVMTFYAYFTDSLWYQKTKVIDYIQMSHEPWKWGWGPSKRDHFSYHKVSTVFWFKNDGPYASAFLLIQSFFFISLCLLYIYWLTLLRRVYSTQEITITFYVYSVSALKQFFLCFFLFYICVFISFFLSYCRSPVEFVWLLNSYTWGHHCLFVLKDYLSFLLTLFNW